MTHEFRIRFEPILVWHIDAVIIVQTLEVIPVMHASILEWLGAHAIKYVTVCMWRADGIHHMSLLSHAL